MYQPMFPFLTFQIIMLSASANKLSRLKEQAEEYAALIMEELDPEGLGYIEVSLLFLLAIIRIFMQCNNLDLTPVCSKKENTIWLLTTR